MNRFDNIYIKILLALISTALSILFSLWLTENFFFDKFYYQKSALHGYKLSKNLQDYGKRSEDLIKLISLINSDNKEPGNVLGISNYNQQLNNTYKIALIGDSYSWGTGIKFEYSVSQKLEKKLKKIRSTKVFSLGFPGNSILDFLSTYLWVKDRYDVDLYIFVLMTNDLLPAYDNDIVVNKDSHSEKIIEICQKKFPAEPLLYYELENDQSDLSFFNKTNLCLLDESLRLLPNKETIYFIPDDYWEMNKNWEIYRSYLEKHNKYYLSASKARTIAEYSKYWENNKTELFRVSIQESHPSKLAHQMYADILYNEIVNNPNFNFGH